ncbi:PREDICTED: putative disease resistance protein RGA3 isoform X1 [Theobroma cacao]|uniref:Disease resistance protein RGA3 isoform X1 n=1 Tax=Theobroma cacao TaxID=3641 RepID=A0AB32W8W0_THECC|nr:PREDICTED: putative disease resistance protein RGA3 isoform X1 [Theobroma cacao]
MAEAVLSALLQVIFEKSTSETFETYALLRGTEKEMRKLQGVLSTIQAVLEDAEDRQAMDKAVKNWLIKLKDVAYDADDLLEEYMTEASRRRLESHDYKKLSRFILNEVRYFFSQSNPILFRYQMRNKLENIAERLDAVADERFKFHLGDRLADSRSQFPQRLQSDSYLLESEVLGREADQEKIVTLLLSSADQRDVSVLPVVGMGGLGKTTLAKLVYNDERVQEHFECRIWVCVSEDFDVKRLMKAIIESMTGNRCDLQETESIHRRVQELIRGLRFLLVLDDVWNDDQEKWDRLKNSVRHGSVGSKILVTTRSEKVALVTGTFAPYHLEGLSDEDCWLLFEHRAFKSGRPEESSSFIAIGKEIAKKCRGVPLAAKSLGSLMYLRRKRSEWLFVKDSEIWRLVEEENGILPVLRLSYDSLPSHLKQCFAYCSLFPKNCRINKDKLILLWIAEGFIQVPPGKSPEEVGNEYFNELLWSSFFQNVTTDHDKNIMDCEMHHLLHDLAKAVAGSSCVTVEVSKRLSVPTGTRYLSVFCADNKIPRGSRNACKLRSFLLLSGHWKTAEVSRKLILSLKSLRSLDISNTGIKKISKSIGLMIHLRYLDLSSTLIKRLPNTVCSLFNLQSLILKHCTRLEKLPKDMRKLINLRHLNLSDCRLLNKLPNGIGDLRSLQTLPVFIVGKEASCSIAELQNLDLHGELEIRNLENVSNSRCSKSAKRANLKEKWNLQSLKLWWEHVDEVHVKENVEHVIEGLQPSFELKKLEIKNYVGSKFPGWLMNPCLTNLVELSLIKCQRCVQLPLLQKLPALEVLTINEMEATMYFCDDLQGNAGGNGFVSLKTLSIENMSNLLGWTTNGGQLILPSLKQLVIDGCPNLGSLPELPSVASMKLDDCSMDLLRMVTRITTLSDLIISGFSELVQLPQGLLKSNPSLLSLEIRDCLELRSFSGELQTLGPLQCLTISNCPELESFSELSGLSSLESLWIDRCDSLVSMPGGMTRLNSLRHVSFSDCENLAALPEAIKYLTCLQTLNIFSCPALETLPEWLGNLVALREMELCYCENLLRLPQSMQRLTALQFLLIRGCPCLEMRCKKDTGADWHKIRHIPFIKINGPYIQALSGF